MLLRGKAYGGVLSFGIKGDVKLASKVVDSLKLASNLANVGTIPSRQKKILLLLTDWTTNR